MNICRGWVDPNTPHESIAGDKARAVCLMDNRKKLRPHHFLCPIINENEPEIGDGEKSLSSEMIARENFDFILKFTSLEHNIQKH